LSTFLLKNTTFYSIPFIVYYYTYYYICIIIGEAVYCDDIPRRSDELYLAVKTSTHAHAKIISIDYTEALSQPGVVIVVDEKDLPGNRNMVGVMPIKDDYVFAREKV